MTRKNVISVKTTSDNSFRFSSNFVYALEWTSMNEQVNCEFLTFL